MSQFRKLALGAAALLTVALAACADVSQPLAPSGEPSFSRGVQSFDRGARRGGEKVQAFRRSRDRGSASDEALITPGRGGTVSAGGVTLRIPPHAVQRAVRVTLTVPNGRLLYARFEPHGLEFRTPATLSFDLGDSDARVLGGVQGLYVGEGPEWSAGEFEAFEAYDALVADGQASFDISHFSGYIVASGYQRSRF